MLEYWNVGPSVPKAIGIQSDNYCFYSQVERNFSG